MASVGSAYIEILPSLKGFQTKVQSELAGMGLDKQVSIVPKVDTSSVDRAASKIEALSTKLKVARDAEADAAGKVAVAEQKLAQVRDASTSKTAAVQKAEQDLDALRKSGDATAKQIEASEKRLETMRQQAAASAVRVTAAEEALASARRKAEQAKTQTEAVQARVDTAKAEADLARVNAEVDKLDGKTADVKVDVDDKGSAARASSGINGVVGTGLRIGVLIPVVAALGGALVGLAGAAAVGGAGLGALVLGFSGVAGAVGAMNDAQTTAGADARQMASQQAAAADSIVSAQERVQQSIQAVENTRLQNADSAIRAEQAVENAEKQLADAQRASLNAQKALNDARDAARRGLEDLAFQVQDGALQQRSAVLQLDSAKQALDATLANPGASERQRQQAQLTYDQATQQLTELRSRNERLAADKAKADAAGVEGSQQVVSAQDQVRSANDKVASSQIAVANAVHEQAAQQRQGAQAMVQAQQQVVDSQRALAAAMRQAGDVGAGSMDKINQAMSNLTPTGQAFATFLFGLKPAFDQIKGAAQDGLLPGVQAGLQAMLPVVPQIVTVVGQLATAMGGLFQAAGQALASPMWANFFAMLGTAAGTILPQLGSVFGQVAGLFAGLITALMPVAPIALQVLSVLVSALQPLIPFIAQIAQVLAGGLLAGFQALAPAIGPLGQALAALAPPVAMIVQQLGGVLAAAIQALAPVIIALAPPITKLAELLGTALIGVIQALAPLLPPLAEFIGQVATMLVGGLMQAVQMILPYLGRIVQVIGTALIGVLTALMPLFPSLIQAFLSVLQAVLPLIPSLLRIVEALLPPLIGLIPILVPLIVQIAEAFAQIMPQLMPIITSLLDGLIPVINSMMPVITMVFGYIVQYISWALNTVVVPLLQNIVIPALRFLADVFVWLVNTQVKPLWDGLGAAIKWVWENVIKKTFDTTKEAVHGVGQAFSDAIDWIGRVWDKMKEIAAVPINFVIQEVYNNGIRKLVNGVADTVGLKDMKLPEIQPVKFAGGGVLPGYAPGRDVVPALLSPGESVLTPEATRALGASTILALNAGLSGRPATMVGGGAFSGGGIARFAGGGIVGSIVGFLGDIGSNVVDLFSDPMAWIKRTFGGDMSPWANLGFQAPVNLIGKLPDFLWEKIKGWLGAGSGGGGAPSGDLAGWINAAIKMTGVPEVWAGPLNTLIMRESGGNPRAINNWDINAQNGIPSQGLMQTIPPTFAAYRDQRLPNNIMDPVANIVAGINYIKSRYGSIFNVQQAVGSTPMGYDSGGWLPPGLTTVYNGTGRPEAIFTGDQWNTLQQGGLGDLDGLPITGTLDLGNGLEARIDARIDMAGHSVGTAITTRRR